MTGGRGWSDEPSMRASLTRYRQAGFSRLGHGNARGADKMAGRIWVSLGGVVQPYDADWRPHGALDRQAGHRRNIAMVLAEKPALVLAYPAPDSSGTWHCVAECLRRGVVVAVCAPWATNRGALVAAALAGVSRYASEMIATTSYMLHDPDLHLYLGTAQGAQAMWARFNTARLV